MINFDFKASIKILYLLFFGIITTSSITAQNTPIAVDNNPTNDCVGSNCWDWYNWSPVQDGMGNTIGGEGIAEDNACGTTIGGTVEYAGPDATPDFTGTLVGANTTDGTTPDVWTFTFDTPLTNPVFDVNSLENDTEMCFTDCMGNPLTITILGTSLDPGPSGAHCVTSGTNFIQITGTYDCIMVTGTVPDNDPYTLGVGTCLEFNPPPPIAPCLTCLPGTSYNLISLDQTGTNGSGLPTGNIEIKSTIIGTYDFLFSDLDVSEDGTGTTFGGWDIDGGTSLLQLNFTNPLTVQQFDIQNLEVESEVSIGTTITGSGASAVLGGQTLTVCSDPSGRMGVDVNPGNGQMNFVKTDGPGCSANPNGSYTVGTNPVSTLYFKYYNPSGGCTGDYFGFKIGVCQPDCDIAISNVTPTAETCLNGNDGKIDITATSSNPPISYSITGPVNQTNATGNFTGLPPGMYDIVVTDAVGGTCEATDNATVDAASSGPCPTISQTNANDPTSFDPCSCGDPLNFYDGNGDITYFHDFVEVTSVTGETWEVSVVSAQAYSDNGVTNIMVGDALTETPAGSGIYRIDLFHPPGVGFTMTVDRTAGGGSFPLMEGGTCVACKQVPTIGQWGLIILGLLILTLGVVALRKREPVLAGYGAVSSKNKFNLPFNKAVFGKMLIVVMAGLAVIFAVAIGLFGYEMTAADVPGSLVAGPMLAYLLHLFVSEKNRK